MILVVVHGLIVADIQSYFTNLFRQGIKPIAYALAIFFFGWAAILLMFPSEQHQDTAKRAIYRVCIGLALILLTEMILSIFTSAAE